MHKCILVKFNNGDSLDDVMAPYDDELEVAPEMVMTKEELIDNYKKECEERSKTYADYYADPIAYAARGEQEKNTADWLKNMKDVEVASGALTDDEIFDFYCKYNGYEKPENEDEYDVMKDFTSMWPFDKDGNFYEQYNKDGQWDWWCIGGRWKNVLINKEGEKGGIFKFEDVDFEAMSRLEPRELALAEARWDCAVNGAEPPAEFAEEIKFNYSGKFYEEKYGTKEGFLRSLTTIHFCGCLDENGWHEAGSPSLPYDDPNYFKELNRIEGEWEDNFYRDFIKDTDPKTMLAVVDCHY